MFRFLTLLIITGARASSIINLFEGDIAGVNPYVGRNAIVDPTLLWPGGIVYYELAPSVDDIRNYILDGMEEYHKKTCIRFVERTRDSKDFVRIEWLNGCWSMVGRQGGMQQLSLGSGCHWKGLVVHELGHAVGFWHEQNRADRDAYIEIFWDNIMPGLEYAFDKLQSWENNYLNEEFDYKSVMLYGETAFSKDSISHTVKPKKADVVIGPVWKKPGFSASDVKRVNRLYECFGEVRPPPPEVPDYVCDFEDDDCKIKNQENMRGKFVRKYETIGKRTGYVMKLVELNANEDYISGRLMTPMLDLYGREKACFTVDIYVDGPPEAAGLDIDRQDSKTEQIYLTKESSDGWKTLKFDLDISARRMRFFITGRTDEYYGKGTVAVDNIRFSRNPC